MAKDDMQTISESIYRLIEPDMKPKQLLKAVQKVHPKAPKKTIVHAAFYALLGHADAFEKNGKAKALHEFAISERKDN